MCIYILFIETSIAYSIYLYRSNWTYIHTYIVATNVKWTQSSWEAKRRVGDRDGDRGIEREGASEKSLSGKVQNADNIFAVVVCLLLFYSHNVSGSHTYFFSICTRRRRISSYTFSVCRAEKRLERDPSNSPVGRATNPVFPHFGHKSKPSMETINQAALH